MSAGAIAAIAYGILSAVGGIIGYVQAKSMPSLVSGVISGVLLVIGGVAAAQDRSWGLPLAAVITALLVIVFVVRLVKTRRFMPAGLMTIAGVIALILMLQS